MEFQPTLFKGFGTLGYDRGHQMPSADRNLNNAQNKTTFYFSNITAQASKLNQGIWANLENKVRAWTAQCDTLYVVTGAMPNTAINMKIDYILDNKNKDVAKPKYYFKALAMKKGKNYYTIAYKMDNETPSSNKFETYQMPVNELEKITGFTFFPDLNENQKKSINSTIWK
jgi:endonuclease G